MRSSSTLFYLSGIFKMNKNLSNLFKALIFGGFALTSPIQAEMQTEQHKAHVHGLSELMIAIEDNHIEIRLESPAMDLLGFEHQATNPKQVALVKETRQQLGADTALYSFSGTKCVLKEMEIDTSSLLDDEHKHDHDEHKHEHDHEKHQHDHDKHKHEHEHEKHQHDHDEYKHEHDDKKHQHDHDEHKHSGEHHEITASYHYECKKTAQLESIQVKLFDIFPSMQHINSMWITEAGQNSKKLNSKDKTIRLK